MSSKNAKHIPGSDVPSRTLHSWSAPAIEDLPALVDLTLKSPIGGNEGGFGWLDATDPMRRLG